MRGCKFTRLFALGLCFLLVISTFSPMVALADTPIPLLPVPSIPVPLPDYLNPAVTFADPVLNSWATTILSRYTTGTIRQSHVDQYCEDVNEYGWIQLDLSNFSRGKIQSLEGIQSFSKCNFEVIDIEGNEITDLTPLTVFTTLKELKISNNKVEDLSMLQLLPELTYVKASHNNIQSLEGLENLTKLQKLILSNNEIEDLTLIRNLTTLEALDVGENNISDLQPLSELTNLKFLYAHHNPIQSLAPLQSLSQLTMLNVSYVALRNDDELKHLSSLFNLEGLVLSGNSIADIRPLSELTGLRYVQLNENHIVDLSPLSTLENLESLFINDNRVKDVEALKDLTSLWYLEANNNWISDLSPLQNLTPVKIVLAHNRIDEDDLKNVSTIVRWLRIGTEIDLSNQDVNKEYPFDEETSDHLAIIRGAHNFSDIVGHWAEPDIQWAYERGIVNGVAEGIFLPNALTTEEQFLKMLLITMGALTEEPVSIPWSEKYYQFALDYGYPVQPATRGEKMTRTQVAELIVATQGQRLTGNAAIQYLLDHGLSNGKTAPTIEGYKGEDYLSRAEAVRFIRNVIDKAIYKVPQRLSWER